jgi:aminomethyltransferase
VRASRAAADRTPHAAFAAVTILCTCPTESPMSTLKQTPLNALHRALGARMVDFGGWDMPVNYGSQIDEHHAVRADAGMFDVSHMCAVDVTRDGARALLRHALANDVNKLASPGRALYSCMLNDAGGVVDDLIVYFFGEGDFRLVVNAGTAEKDLAWLARLNDEGGFGAALTPRRDLAIIAAQGPNARDKVWHALGEPVRALTAHMRAFHAVRAPLTPFGEMMLGRTGYTGEDGFELIVASERVAALWQALAGAGVRPCGLGARDTLRLEAGMNLYGQDMDDAVSPLDAGLAWTVVTEMHDFVGKAAMQAAGQRRAFVGLMLRETAGILRAHQRVITPLGDGEVTSGTYSPTLKAPVGLARVPVGVGPGDTVQVEIRGRQLAATVVKLPFVRHGKSLVAPAGAV